MGRHYSILPSSKVCLHSACIHYLVAKYSRLYILEPEFSVAIGGKSVMSNLLQQQPNMSLFNTPSSSSSTPESGSSGRRTSLFKRAQSNSSSSKRQSQSQQQLQMLLAQAQQEQQQQKEREQDQLREHARQDSVSFPSISRVKENDGPSGERSHPQNRTLSNIFTRNIIFDGPTNPDCAQGLNGLYALDPTRTLYTRHRPECPFLPQRCLPRHQPRFTRETGPDWLRTTLE